MLLTITDCLAKLKKAEKIAVLCHKDPDGDTLGSAAALVLALRALGKEAALFCADCPPKKYAYFLEGVQTDGFVPTFVLSVDVADQKLLGDLAERFPHIDLAIDHHTSHRPFAEDWWVEGENIACAMMIFDLVREMGISLSKQMANALYTGIVTDSGCFLYPATSARTHRMAADLMEAGADFAFINKTMFETKSVNRVAVEKACLNNLTLHFDGRCAYSLLDFDLLQSLAADPSDFDGVAGLPRQLEGVLVGVFVREKEKGVFKVSIRSNENADASAVCRLFGGGGHFHAAGCTLTGDALSVQREILSAVEKII